MELISLEMDEQCVFLGLVDGNAIRSFLIDLSDTSLRIFECDTQRIYYAVGVSLLIIEKQEPPNIRLKILVGGINSPLNLIEILNDTIHTKGMTT
jgi:hypothetical protein